MRTSTINKLAMMYGLMAVAGTDIFNSHRELPETDIKKMKPIKPIKKIIPKNHTEFFYGLNSVFALNRKNADKKAKSKGYL